MRTSRTMRAMKGASRPRAISQMPPLGIVKRTVPRMLCSGTGTKSGVLFMSP